MDYTESYCHLSHGTDEETAHKIVLNGFIMFGDKDSWCGKGVYFYDIKAKSWWAAGRKCGTIRKRTGQKAKPAIVLATYLKKIFLI